MPPGLPPVVRLGMTAVLEAVPNFSEGRDLDLVEHLVETIAAHDVEVLDWSADPDHHRSVVTFIGAPNDVEEASFAAAVVARDRIDLTRHTGIHPRVGSLDVLPFVPLHGLEMSDAVASAHRVGRRIAEAGIPVYFYGAGSTPPGRGLAELRRGGVEALRGGWPPDRTPDLRAGDGLRPHPTAGVTCVGARPVLLAWNVFVEGIDEPQARAIARTIRERDGGFAGLRALGLTLATGDRVQISMNLEDPERTSPLEVFDRIAAEARHFGGRVTETEVIGMMPDTLVLADSQDRLELPDLGAARVLSHRVAEYVARHADGPTETSDTAE